VLFQEVVIEAKTSGIYSPVGLLLGTRARGMWLFQLPDPPYRQFKGGQVVTVGRGAAASYPTYLYSCLFDQLGLGEAVWNKVVDSPLETAISQQPTRVSWTVAKRPYASDDPIGSSTCSKQKGHERCRAKPRSSLAFPPLPDLVVESCCRWCSSSA
jgi:hypothetical protein